MSKPIIITDSDQQLTLTIEGDGLIVRSGAALQLITLNAQRLPALVEIFQQVDRASEITTLGAVAHELERARKAHAPLHSGHEALAVIREEYLEVEKEVFRRERDHDALRKELIQLAAMAVRALEDLDLCPEQFKLG